MHPIHDPAADRRLDPRARQVITLYEQGRLHGSRFEAPARPPPTLRDIVTGISQSLILLLVVAVIRYLVTVYQPLR